MAIINVCAHIVACRKKRFNSSTNQHLNSNCSHPSLKDEFDTEGGEDGELVDTLERHAVEIEEVVAVVEIGNTCREFEHGTLADGNLALGTDVEAVVGWQSAFVNFGIVDAIFAI